MKERKQANKSKACAAKQVHLPTLKTPGQSARPKRPPLAGDALELKIAEVLCRRFRNTAERYLLRAECHGAEQGAIEAAIVSPRVRAFVEPVAQAYALEQTIVVLQLLFTSAKAAVENEKASAAQVAALRIIIEILLEKFLERIWGGVWQETAGGLFASEFEKSLVEDLLQLVRGQKVPAVDDPPQVLKRGEEIVMANGERSEPAGESGGC